VVRFALRLVRTHYGRALAAWCVLLAIALEASAQYPAFDGPPAGMDPEREAEFGDGASILATDGEDGQVIEDGGEPNAVDYGPQVGAQYGAPYDYIKEQGLPYVMQQEGGAYQPGSFYNPDEPPPPPSTYSPWLTRFGFRHSYTHGRNVGWGLPLVGSSWLNRPYYLGATLGPMWLTNRPADSVPRDQDVIGNLIYGWDWDYYWGSEFQYGYATPELHNTADPTGTVTNRMVSWNYSFMYYPWGDSNLRPFWRLGVGDTNFDFPTDDGTRWDEWLFTTPFGVGMKYSLRRWLAARVEFTDQFSWGNHGVATQHNLTLNFGLEFRFGGKRKAYWPWNPNSHIW
jgi:hypothetical protein